MDVNELARLRAVAEAARKSDWKARVHPDHPAGTLSIYTETGWVIRPTKHGGFLNDNEDAAHIAAFDPPTVLALLAEVERLRVEVEQLRDDLLRLQEIQDKAWGH